MPSRHVRSVVPNPWDPVAPTWYIVGMFDLLFPTREMLQPLSDTSYACWNCYSLPVRPCSPTRIARRHVRSDIFLTREILQPRCDTPYACLNCCSLSVRSWSPILIWFAEPVRSCSPILILCSHVRPCVPSPWYHSDSSHARSIWCFEPVISWSHLLKPSRHVRSVVRNPW